VRSPASICLSIRTLGMDDPTNRSASDRRYYRLDIWLSLSSSSADSSNHYWPGSFQSFLIAPRRPFKLLTPPVHNLSYCDTSYSNPYWLARAEVQAIVFNLAIGTFLHHAASPGHGDFQISKYSGQEISKGISCLQTSQ